MPCARWSCWLVVCDLQRLSASRTGCCRVRQWLFADWACFHVFDGDGLAPASHPRRRGLFTGYQIAYQIGPPFVGQSCFLLIHHEQHVADDLGIIGPRCLF